MDLKERYEKETKQKPYCWNKRGQYVRSGSYSDGYVKWLERQLSIHNGVGQSEQLPCSKCENGLIWSKDRLKAKSCDCRK